MSKKIKDLVVGESVVIECRAEWKYATAKNGNSYFTATLSDRSGTIEAKKFGELPLLNASPCVVLVSGVVEEFNGSRQLKITDITTVMGDPDQFRPRSKYTDQELARGIAGEINAIANSEIRGVVWEIMDRHTGRFLRSPAAVTYHHAYVGGLAEHTLSMCGLVDPICAHVAKFYGAQINVDLVRAGVILHDMGKIAEYDDKNPREGRLIPHIPWGAIEVDRVCFARGVSETVRQNMIHVILSHHGELAYGSPVTPRLIEAEIVRRIDGIDAKMRQFTTTLDDLGEGVFDRRLGGEVWHA